MTPPVRVPPRGKKRLLLTGNGGTLPAAVPGLSFLHAPTGLPCGDQPEPVRQPGTTHPCIHFARRFQPRFPLQKAHLGSEQDRGTRRLADGRAADHAQRQAGLPAPGAGLRGQPCMAVHFQGVKPSFLMPHYSWPRDGCSAESGRPAERHPFPYTTGIWRATPFFVSPGGNTLEVFYQSQLCIF